MISKNGPTTKSNLRAAAAAAARWFIWLMRNEQLLAMSITMMVILLGQLSVMAQTGPGPINIWQRSDTDLWRGILNLVRIAKWLMIVLGVLGICYAIGSIIFRKPFAYPLIGGVLSLSAGVIIAFSDSLFKKDVDLPDALGN